MPSTDAGTAAAPLPTRPLRLGWLAHPGTWTALAGIATLAVILAAWELLSRLGWLNEFFFPPPSLLFATTIELLQSGFPDGITLTTHVLMTLQRIVLGFLIAAALAVPAGIVIGYFEILSKMTSGIITFGRSIAAISVLPLFIAWFGIGEAAKVALIALGAFWVIVTYTIAGVRFVDPLLLRVARSLDTPGPVIFARVILPAALPRIFTGLKVALSVAFMIIVAAEMIATVTGLGAMITEARTSFRTDITMVGMLAIGLLGWLVSRLLDGLEQVLLPWRKGGLRA